MTRKLIVSALLAATLTTNAATAADVSAPVHKAQPVATVYDWTGFYVGLHAAGAWTDVKNTGLIWGAGDFITPGQPQALGIEQSSHRNFVSNQYGGGFQAGYNYQLGRSVLGVEADMTWFGNDGGLQFRTGYVNSPQVYTIGYHADINWLATIRGRIGYSFDRVLVYGTGGAAIAEANFGWTFSDTLGATGGGEDHKVRVRPVFGGGLEYALTDNFLLKLDYLYIPLGTFDAPGQIRDPLTQNTVTGSADLNTHLFKAGLNYKFGGPVAAKY